MIALYYLEGVKVASETCTEKEVPAGSISSEPMAGCTWESNEVTDRGGLSLLCTGSSAGWSLAGAARVRG